MDRQVSFACKSFRVISAFAAVMLFVNTALVVVNIILRRFFNAPIYGTTEIVRYISLFVASFAIVENEWIDGNVSMTLLVDSISRKSKPYVMFFANLITTVGFLVIDWLLIKQTMNRIYDGTVTTELRFPLYIPCAFLAVGFILLTLVLALKTWLWAWMAKTGEEIRFIDLGRR